MDLSIRKLNKVFLHRKVLNDLTFDIKRGNRFAITGSNGAGKSTLLKILSGAMVPSSGNIEYRLRDQSIDELSIFKYLHFVAPYNSVIEELTLSELFHFHRKHSLLKGFSSVQQWLNKLDYPFDKHQQLKIFSSGMKQRVKLGLAMLDDRPLLLLDEPTSNLDEKGKTWFYQLVKELKPDQTLVIASNDTAEIALCDSRIDLNPRGNLS